MRALHVTTLSVLVILGAGCAPSAPQTESGIALRRLRYSVALGGGASRGYRSCVLGWSNQQGGSLSCPNAPWDSVIVSFSANVGPFFLDYCSSRTYLDLMNANFFHIFVMQAPRWGFTPVR